MARILRFWIGLTVFSLAATASLAVCTTQVEYDAQPTAGNPLRGFVAFQGDLGDRHFPTSLEYAYMAMKDLMKDEDGFQWTGLERKLDDIASRHHQAVFRVYLDYPNCCPPGSYSTGVPAFLLEGPKAVKFTDYKDHGGGKTPDYNNPRLVAAVEAFIGALGSKFDADPRIAFVQVGLLGFWGEWHTYPYNGANGKPNYFASRDTQVKVLKAFHAAFKTTQLVVAHSEMSYWSTASPASQQMHFRIGYHDDSFCDDTYDAKNSQAWFFHPKLVAHKADKRWQKVAIGGEITPPIQHKVFAGAWAGQDYDVAARKVHASWLLNHFAFKRDTNKARLEATRKAALLLGYQFSIESVSLIPRRIPEDISKLHLQVVLKNRGIAPFYYKLHLTAAVQHGGTASAAVNTKTLQPGKTTTIDLYPSAPAHHGTETHVTLGFTSPMLLKKSHMNFANKGAAKGALTVTLSCASSSSPTAVSPARRESAVWKPNFLKHGHGELHVV